MITTARDGKVSKPENGGAKNAVKVNKAITKPVTLNKILSFSKPLNLGLEYLSNHFSRLTSEARTLPCAKPDMSIAFQRRGSQTASLPNIISNESSTAMASKTCVSPPVGSGKEGINNKTSKQTAKLFSSKTSIKSATVFGCLDFNQVSS